MAKRKQIDWEKIELDYRAGIKTLREIAGDHDISHVSIAKKAKKEEWPRDLSAKIKQKAKDKVNKAQVNSTITKLTEKQVVDNVSTVIANKELEHRKDIVQKRTLVNKLFEEIESLTGGKELIEQITLTLQQGDFEGLAKEVKKLSSLPQRIKGTTDLVSALRVLYALERQAFRMDETEGVGSTVEEFLNEVSKRNKGLVAVDEN